MKLFTRKRSVRDIFRFFDEKLLNILIFLFVVLQLLLRMDIDCAVVLVIYIGACVYVDIMNSGEQFCNRVVPSL